MEKQRVVRHDPLSGLVSASRTFLISDRLVCAYIIHQLLKRLHSETNSATDILPGERPAFKHLFSDKGSAKLVCVCVCVAGEGE